jgi:hypothetical protein
MLGSSGERFSKRIFNTVSELYGQKLCIIGHGDYVYCMWKCKRWCTGNIGLSRTQATGFGFFL